jgi:GntR family transcriptional regulator
MIARNPSLTDQVKSHLKERIRAGAFEGGRIPSETELATELGVSRTTIRDALTRLENEGSIYRRQGAGTFVNEPGLQIKSRLEDIWAYEDVLRDHGYTPSVRVLGVDEQPADGSVANDLKIDEGDPILAMEKLFLEDDRPVVLTINRVPVACLDDAPHDDAATPLFVFLEAHSDRNLAYYLSEIIPVCLDARRAELLGVPEGTPVVCFEEIGFDQDNAPLVQSTSYFRDDLLRFSLIRRRAGA